MWYANNSYIPNSMGITMASTSSKTMIPAIICCVFLFRIRNISFTPYRLPERILYMKTLLLSSLIVFCILIAYENHKHKKMEEKFKQDFWEREDRANHVRKKSLDGLPYITLPLESFPMELLKEDPAIAECQRQILALSDQKIVNLTGYTNTDLKLEYGTANITCLSEYDYNYTLLARTLQEWAEALYKAGFLQEAARLLEFALSTETDVSHSYYLLADIYNTLGCPEKKDSLLMAAEHIRTPIKNTIVRTLQGEGPYSGWLHSS